MGKGRTQVAAAALALGLAGCAGARPVDFEPVGAAEAAAARNVHDFRGGPLCQGCHLRGQPAPALLRADPVALCKGCHPGMKGGNHPVAVAARSSTGGLPLWNGQVTCDSCHDPHAIRVNKGIRVQGSALCLKCHQQHGRT